MLADLLEICKPKVVMLMLITAWVGMYLADTKISNLSIIIYASLGICSAAASGAILNHIIDRKIDRNMQRTAKRPIASNRISVHTAYAIAILLAILANYLLINKVNLTAAILSNCALIGYGAIYSIFLKHSTSQNIVIGGLAGAMPPLLGWSAISNSINPFALLLVLIIFSWTPPHFWSLAIARVDDYKATQIPMLPVTHGISYSKLHILLYTLLLAAVSLLPFCCNMNNLYYLAISIVLNIGFIYYALRLYYCSKQTEKAVALAMFRYSIWYLGLLFAAVMLTNNMESALCCLTPLE